MKIKNLDWIANESNTYFYSIAPVTNRTYSIWKEEDGLFYPVWGSNTPDNKFDSLKFQGTKNLEVIQILAQKHFESEMMEGLE